MRGFFGLVSFLALLPLMLAAFIAIPLISIGALLGPWLVAGALWRGEWSYAALCGAWTAAGWGVFYLHHRWDMANPFSSREPWP